MLLINLGVIRAKCIGSENCHTHEAELKLNPTDDVTRGNVIGRVALQRDLVRQPLRLDGHTPWLNRIFSSAAVLAKLLTAAVGVSSRYLKS